MFEKSSLGYRMPPTPGPRDKGWKGDIAVELNPWQPM